MLYSRANRILFFFHFLMKYESEEGMTHRFPCSEEKNVVSREEFSQHHFHISRKRKREMEKNPGEYFRQIFVMRKNTFSHISRMKTTNRSTCLSHYFHHTFSRKRETRSDDIQKVFTNSMKMFTFAISEPFPKKKNFFASQFPRVTKEKERERNIYRNENALSWRALEFEEKTIKVFLGLNLLNHVMSLAIKWIYTTIHIVDLAIQNAWIVLTFIENVLFCLRWRENNNSNNKIKRFVSLAKTNGQHCLVKHLFWLFFCSEGQSYWVFVYICICTPYVLCAHWKRFNKSQTSALVFLASRILHCHSTFQTFICATINEQWTGFFF